MADWQQLVQSVVLGLIFSYLLAKLISIVISFKDDNLSISRSTEPKKPEPEPETLDRDHDHDHDGSGSSPPAHDSQDSYSMVAEQGSVGNDSVYGDDGDGDDDDDDDDYDDWEGVESTELDETFSAATAFVAAAAADRVSEKVSNELQLKLYGFYKIATEGPCSAPQPSALKMTARAKWY